MVRQSLPLVSRHDAASPSVSNLQFQCLGSAYAVRSPWADTMDAKCSPIVCSSSGGFQAGQSAIASVRGQPLTSLGPMMYAWVDKPLLQLPARGANAPHLDANNEVARMISLHEQLYRTLRRRLVPWTRKIKAVAIQDGLPKTVYSRGSDRRARSARERRLRGLAPMN